LAGCWRSVCILGELEVAAQMNAVDRLGRFEIARRLFAFLQNIKSGTVVHSAVSRCHHYLPKNPVDGFFGGIGSFTLWPTATPQMVATCVLPS
jgi:hypothetical protein